MNSPKQWRAPKSTPGKVNFTKGAGSFAPMSSGKRVTPSTTTKPNYVPVPQKG